MSEIRGKPWLLAVAVFCLIAVAIAPIGAKRAAAQGTPAFLEPGQWLNSGQSLWATNEDGYGLELIMQTDGNLVEYGPNGALWASGSDTPNSSAIMQTDGNLVIYAPGLVPVWASGTNGHPNSTFVEQTDDNLVIYAPGDVAIWSSGLNLVPSGGDATFESGWEDCEYGYGCTYQTVTYEIEPTSLVYNVPGGYLIVQDYLNGYFQNAATNPVAPVAASYSQGNYQEGYGFIYQATSWGGGFIGGDCEVYAYGNATPGGWLEDPCVHTSYNAEGHKYTGSWDVQAAVSIGPNSTYQWDGYGDPDPVVSYQ